MGVHKARFGAARVRQVSPLAMMKSFGHNNECPTVEVIGQDWSNEVEALYLVD